MSVNNMNRTAMYRAAAAAPPGDGGAGGRAPAEPPGAPPAPSNTQVLADLARYVPTEVLTIYVAALGLYGIADRIAEEESLTTGIWIALGFGLLLTPLVVWIDWLIKQRPLPAAERTRLPLYNPIAAAVAFLAWAIALPATPFSDVSFYSAAVAGFVALVVSYALGKLDQLFAPQARADAPGPPPEPPPAPAPA